MDNITNSESSKNKAEELMKSLAYKKENAFEKLTDDELERSMAYSEAYKLFLDMILDNLFSNLSQFVTWDASAVEIVKNSALQIDRIKIGIRTCSEQTFQNSIPIGEIS